jgi:formamidopyrimidine-DNA glycosylase
MAKNRTITDYSEWSKHDKKKTDLESEVWQWVKKGYPCLNCGVRVTGRVMFRQWKKNHRFLCPSCETIEELKGGDYKKVRSSHE